MSEYTVRDFQYIVAPILGWLVAQSIKFVLQLRKDGVQWQDFTMSGGMPSSHAAFTMSLTTLIGLVNGIETAVFGVSAAVTMLVVYDAMDVRRATGQQTVAIHELAAKTKHKLTTPIHVSRGHSPVELAAGLCVGVMVGSLVYILL